ncbi:MAG TPA: class I SAM-dependent methyltransferase [Acidimicrobiales bacterium]|nr:class I SAM-dependent methyltransferase [Acidimicrobiales bacterium]
MADVPTCRSCGAHELERFLSLGVTPLADALVSAERLGDDEDRYPLDVSFCPRCSLVQITTEVPPAKLFVDNYLYFSSFSDALLRHSREHAIDLVDAHGLGPHDLVVEVGSNDGYLLRSFAERGVPVLGIDPAPDQASAAIANGIPTITEFFGLEIAERLRDGGRRASVIVANNVMAHVPDLNGFVAGLGRLVSDDGVITIENPYVRDLIVHREFDTIYHEHHCYFSCTAIDALMRRNGLWLNDVTYFADLHGGTLRWTVGPARSRSETVSRYLREEVESGLTAASYYRDFASQVEQVKTELLALLHGLRADGRRVAAYGAAAKGSTLVNYVGIGTDLVEYVVDRNDYKQGRYMPGTHQPIAHPDRLLDDQPDYVLILAWNFADEIVSQQQEYLRRGGQFIVPLPSPRIIGAT